MNNAIVSFAFEGHEVRGFEYAGEPHFVGNEVAAALGYANPKNAVATHCKSLKLLKSLESGLLGIPCGPRGMNIIPERDVYRLVMRSNLPTAEAFEEKVVGEILPSIRKTGGYMVAAKEETPEELALRAVTVLQATLARREEENRREIERQKALIDEAAPKAAALEELAGMDGVFGLREAAKECGWPEGKFIQRLHEMRWIFKQEPNRPWQAHSDKLRGGLLAHKTYEQTKPNGEVSLRYQVVVTAKGLTRLAVKLGPAPEGKRAVPFAKKPEPAS